MPNSVNYISSIHVFDLQWWWREDKKIACLTPCMYITILYYILISICKQYLYRLYIIENKWMKRFTLVYVFKKNFCIFSFFYALLRVCCQRYTIFMLCNYSSKHCVRFGSRLESRMAAKVIRALLRARVRIGKNEIKITTLIIHLRQFAGFPRREFAGERASGRWSLCA